MLKFVPEFIAISRLAVACILAQLAQVVLISIDNVMAGRHSTDTLAAFGVATQIIIPVLILSMGLFFSINAIVADLAGKQERKKISDLIKTCWILSVFAGGICIVLLNNSAVVLELFEVEEALRPGVADYLGSVSFGIIPYFFFLVLRFTCEGLLKAKYVMYASVLAIPIKILCNYIFVFGAFGTEPLGARGIGIATSITWSFMLAVLAFALFVRSGQERIRIFAGRFTFEGRIALEVFKTGAPIGVTMGASVIFLSVTGMLIGGISSQAMAAHQSAYNFTFFIFMFFQGLSVATTSRIAYLNGAGDSTSVVNVIRIVFFIALAIGSINSGMILLFADQIGHIYSKDEALIEKISLLLFWGAMLQFPQAIQEIASGVFRGFKKTLTPTFVYIISFGLSLVFAYHAATSWEFEERGYWMGLCLGYCVASAGLLVLLYRFYRNTFVASAKDHGQSVRGESVSC